MGGKRSHTSFEGGAGGSSKMKFSERLSAMTGRGGGSSAQRNESPAGGRETKEEKEQRRADNAQNASSNTANQANGGGQAGDNGQEMLEMFLLQAGMTRRDDAKKRRAMLTGDA
jgi:hypothetical protein